MQYISATDAKRTLGAVIDKAQREPVMIKRQNRDAAVLISPDDYNRLRGLNVKEFQEFCDDVAKQAAGKGLTEEILNDILADDNS